jgi:hypothetical protein
MYVTWLIMMGRKEPAEPFPQAKLGGQAGAGVCEMLALVD